MEVQRQNITAALGVSDDEDLDVLGRVIKYETGEVLVPRDWLLQRCDDLDVPEVMHPNAPTPLSAYKRAMQRVVTTNPQIGDMERTDKFHVEVNGKTHKVKLRLEEGDGYVRHLYADVFFPEDEVGVEGGRWSTHELGHFNWSRENDAFRRVKNQECPDGLESLWEEMAEYARALQKELENRHTGEDLRHMIYLNMILNSPPDWPNIVSLAERGWYFIPEGTMMEVIEAMETIYEEANQWKEGGNSMGLHYIEVLDTDEKREWVRSRVEDSLEQVVDDAIEEAWEALDEGDDTVDEIVETVVERIDAEAGEGVEAYNQLLQAKLDVEEKLEKRASDLDDDDKEEVIQRAMDKVDV